MSQPALADRDLGDSKIHPTAVVDKNAELAPGVEIGAYATVGPRVVLGEGTIVQHHGMVQGDTVMGKRNRVFPYAVVGGEPQDVKYKPDQPSRLRIGDDNVIREFATLHTSARPEVSTEIGNRTLLMSYVHIAHDCSIGDDVKIANATQMAGHVIIEPGATVGGLVAIHQFVRIGALSMVGGGSRVPKDIPPFSMAAGNPLRVVGANSVGLERKGKSASVRKDLKKAMRLLCSPKRSLEQALEDLEKEFGPLEEVQDLLKFVRSSERGIHR